MKQIKMTFPNYPMLAYFMNMFNVNTPPAYTLLIEGPTTDTVPVTLSFHTMQTVDYEFVHKMFATAGGLSFSVADYPPTLESQFPETHVDDQSN